MSKQRAARKKSDVLPAERERVEVVIAQCLVRGYRIDEIVDTLNADATLGRDFTRTRVMKAVDILRSRWVQETYLDMDIHFVRTMKTLDHIEAELWKTWERSQKERKTKQVTEEQTTINHKGGENETLPATIRRKVVNAEERIGDVSIMDRILEVTKIRMRLLGLEAPIKVANPDGSRIGNTTNVQLNIGVAGTLLGDPLLLDQATMLSHRLSEALRVVPVVEPVTVAVEHVADVVAEGRITNEELPDAV